MKKVLIVLAVLAVSGMASAELLSNPGFEAGDTWSQWGMGYFSWGGASWYTSKTLVTDAAAARSGSNYLVNSVDAWWGYSTVWENVLVTPGDTYSLSGYLMDNNGSSAAAGSVGGIVRFQWMDDSGGTLGFTDNNINILSDHDLGWQQFSVTGTAPVGTFVVRAGFQVNDGAIRIDDASMALVPEPATMALLGLGGLFLRRKK